MALKQESAQNNEFKDWEQGSQHFTMCQCFQLKIEIQIAMQSISVNDFLWIDQFTDGETEPHKVKLPQLRELGFKC